jgi:hypothetical protein
VGLCNGYEANEEVAIFLGHAEGLGELSGEAGELGVPSSSGDCSPKFGPRTMVSGLRLI